MTSNRKTARAKQDKQFFQLLKDFGITGRIPSVSDQERKKIDKLFPN